MAENRIHAQDRLLSFMLLFSVGLSTVRSTAQVPLLIWSTDSLPPLASPSAGHISSDQELTAYLSPVFASGPHTVLLFLQEKLSKDDLTRYGGVFGNKQDSAFKNLEAALQSSSSVTFPALEWRSPSAITALLEAELRASPVLADPDSLSHLSIDASVNNLMLINLPYCSDSLKSCKELLRNNDEVLGKVLSVVQTKGVPYISIYTGQQPSRVISETAVPQEKMGRSLLQAVEADVKPPIIFNVTGRPCIMLWAQNLNVSTKSGEWIDLATQIPQLTGSCSPSNSQLVLSYPSGYVLSFSMTQRFYPVSARNWFSLDTVELEVGGVSASYVGSRGIYAPAEYSFRCQSVNNFQDALLVRNSTNSSLSVWSLNFIDFQIQGFGLNNGTNFSYASDCASFFTPAIWMGLLTSLLMLLIFLYGLHMIMQLNTMDRFDDPKGPFISVPQSE
uniref:ATPase H+ transporting accessory protein 1b n=1 Tax=Oryzias latipes TaxID=8090 RepID=A0A3P9IR75_ORYLA